MFYELFILGENDLFCAAKEPYNVYETLINNFEPKCLKTDSMTRERYLPREA